jgi:cytochrome c
MPVDSLSQSGIGNAGRGAAVVESKGCLLCHSVNGRGGTSAPDLAERTRRAYTPSLLASVMWNHGPDMWAAGSRIRSLSSGETADLFAHFYSLLYFSAPGNATRGQRVFEQNQCVVCHAPGGTGAPMSLWFPVNDPMWWAERMWNHSGEMLVEMDRLQVKWPRLSAENMVDLLAYIRNNPAARSQSAALSPGEAEKGRRIFDERCVSCHTFDQRAANKVALLDRAGPGTLTGYVTAMWNHAPSMRRMAGINFPKFVSGEMNDLVAYMFAERYFDERGDAIRGRSVYETKSCAACHETGAADLTQVRERYSPITMASALWRHGPATVERLRQQGIPWPQFTGQEMANLVAYLNSRGDRH